MSSDVRRAVLARVGAGADSRFSRNYLVADITREIGCGESEVYETLWGLVAAGLLFLNPAGQGSSTDNWRWQLTADGRAAHGGGEWEPRDPEGYLGRLEQAVPGISPGIRMYLVESLRAFNSRCYLASSVMLGVAAERAFLDMAEKFGKSRLPGADRVTANISKPRNTYYFLWTEFRKVLAPIRSDLPDGLADVLTLDATADLIRVTRNDAGHPSGKQIDEDTARAHLTIAPVYLGRMHRLADYFSLQAKVGDQ